MRKTGPELEVDYAFFKKETEEFGNAHILLEIGNSQIRLIIQSNENVTEVDLENLLTELQEIRFKKMHLVIARDTYTILELTDKKYHVIFENEIDIKIKELVEI